MGKCQECSRLECHNRALQLLVEKYEKRNADLERSIVNQFITTNSKVTHIHEWKTGEETNDETE